MQLFSVHDTEDDTDGASPSFRRRLHILIIALMLAATAVSVYYGIWRLGGVPDIPEIRISSSELEMSVRRLRERADSVALEAYHQEVMAAYVVLNQTEGDVSSADDLDRLLIRFEEKTGIPATGDKERFLLLGDHLAVEFENRLQRFLATVPRDGIRQIMSADSTEYRDLLEISGRFLHHSLEMGIIGEDGRLMVSEYIPQIVFRRRWRMLGGLPYRYQFLEIESLVDHYFLLRHSPARQTRERLRSAREVKRLFPEFDEVIAQSVIYYDVGDIQRAISTLEPHRDRKADPETLRRFLRYLQRR